METETIFKPVHINPKVVNQINKAMDRLGPFEILDSWNENEIVIKYNEWKYRVGEIFIMWKPEVISKPRTSDIKYPEDARNYADQLEKFEAQKPKTKEYKMWQKEITNAPYVKVIENIKLLCGLNEIPEEYQNGVWTLAWDEGHSYGLSEVICKLTNILSTIFKV